MNTFGLEEVKKIEKFLDFFKFEKTEAFIKALEDFTSNPDSEMFRKNIAYQCSVAMMSTRGKNELVDLAFKDLFPGCEKMRFELEFDKDLEDIIGVDPNSDQA
jgi:hypothetical protein